MTDCDINIDTVTETTWQALADVFSKDPAAVLLLSSASSGAGSRVGATRAARPLVPPIAHGRPYRWTLDASGFARAVGGNK